MFLAAATLFSCSYDSSEIENGITDLENRVAALEQKADYLESQLKRGFGIRVRQLHLPCGN